MTKALELAVSKASALPAASQEIIAYELLERIDALSALRSALAEGVAELDAGLGSPLDAAEVISAARAEYAAR